MRSNDLLKQNLTNKSNIKMENKSSKPNPSNLEPTCTVVFSKIFKGDKVIWSVFIALTIISLIEVFSSTSTSLSTTKSLGTYLRHATFLLEV